MDKIAAIILAAGLSSRMERFKPLLPLGENTVLERTVEIFQEGGIYDIRVVLGHNADKIRPLLNKKNIHLIFNPQYHNGMFSSIKAGVRSIESSVDGFLLLPVDIPLVKPGTVRDMARAFSISRAGIIYPCYQGKRGHPVFVANSYRELILEWPGPGGLNQLLYQFEKEIMEVHVDDQGILMDMDTIDDYKRFLSFEQEVLNHGKYGFTEHPLQHC